jgi:hypothetical protein
MKRIIAVAAGLLAITLMHVNPAIAASSGEYSHVNVVQADSDNFLYINVAPPSVQQRQLKQTVLRCLQVRTVRRPDPGSDEDRPRVISGP